MLPQIKTSTDIVSSFIVTRSSRASSRKYRNIETLRGLAIILVVFGHMMNGMRVPEDSVLEYFHYSLGYIRMPIFTVISGWLYANRPMNTNRSTFLRGKLRRLILPMFMVSTLLFLSRMIVPGTNYSPALWQLPLNLIFPYDVFWFLYSLFLIFLVISILDTKGFLHQVSGWLIALAASVITLFLTQSLLETVPNLFSFKGAAYLFPFFLLGMGICRFKDRLLNEKMTLLMFCIFIVGVTIQQMSWFGYIPMQGRDSPLGLMVGASSIMLIFRLPLQNRLLSWIGGYAFGIFLFHVFFTGGSRIILSHFGLENEWIMVTAGTLVAISFSILAEKLVSYSHLLRFHLLGQKRPEKR